MGLQPDLDFFSQVFGYELIPVNLPLSEDGNDLIKTVIKLIYYSPDFFKKLGLWVFCYGCGSISRICSWAIWPNFTESSKLSQSLFNSGSLGLARRAAAKVLRASCQIPFLA